MEWNVADPITGSRKETGTGGVVNRETESDPEGVNVGQSDPNLAGSYEPSPEAGLIDLVSGRDDGTSGRCQLDGISVRCALADSLLRSGVAVSAPAETTRRVYNQATERYEWRFFQAFADGFQGFVPMGGTSSGTGGIKLANGNEAWGYLGSTPDLFFAHAQQQRPDPNFGLGEPPPPQSTPCDRKFAATFGGTGAAGRTAYDYNGRYSGRDPAAEARVAGNPRSEFSNPLFDVEHLYYFPHLSGNPGGTENTEVYVPGNYVRGSVTPPTRSDAVVTVYYKEFFGVKDVTLAIFHVGDYGLQRTGDRLRIGSTGGPGGDESRSRPGSPNKHAHFELWRGRGYLKPGAGRDAARIALTPVICP